MKNAARPVASPKAAFAAYAALHPYVLTIIINNEAKPDPRYDPVPTMELAVVLTVLGNRSPSIENAAGSVADTKAPKTNLIASITPNEVVTDETKVLKLHAITAPTIIFFLLILSTSNPMKIPHTAYEILNAGPESSP